MGVTGRPGWVVVRRGRQGLFLVDAGNLESHPHHLPVDTSSTGDLAVLPAMTGLDGPCIVATSSDGLRLVRMRGSGDGMRFTGETATVSLPPLTRCAAAGPSRRPALLTGDAGGTVRRLDAQILLETAVFQQVASRADEGRRGIRLLARGPGGDTVICHGRDDRVELRELRGGTVVARTREKFTALALASTVSASPRVVVAEPDSRLYLLDPANGLEIETSVALPERFGVSCLLPFLHSGRALLAAGSDDGRVAVWDLERAELVVPPTKVNEGRKIALALIQHDGTLLAGCGDGTIQVLNLVAGDAGGASATLLARTLCSHREHVRVLTVTSLEAGDQVASAGDDGSLYLTALRLGTTYELQRAHGGKEITALTSLAAGIVASGGADGVVRVWGLGPQAAQLLITVPLDTPINRMCLADRLLVVATSDGLVALRVEHDLLVPG